VNLVADASTPIAELLRARGRALFQRADVRILVPKEQWADTERGLAERARALRRKILDEDVVALLAVAHHL
jgi:hypothetical protein